MLRQLESWDRFYLVSLTKLHRCTLEELLEIYHFDESSYKLLKRLMLEEDET